MMCGHCEAQENKALEAIDGVTEAVAIHEKVEDDVLTKAVEEQDYKVVSVE